MRRSNLLKSRSSVIIISAAILALVAVTGTVCAQPAKERN